MSVPTFPGFPPPPDASLSQFDTPKAIATRMAQWAGIDRGMRVLEPSAGLGNLATAAKQLGADVRCIEWSKARAQWLERAGFTVTQANFLEVPRGERFDLVLMNPPFEDGQDCDHVLHALNFAPRVVALLPLGTLDGVDRFQRLWTRHGLRRMAVLVRRFKSEGTAQSGQRPFAVFEFIANERQSSTGVEWWS